MIPAEAFPIATVLRAAASQPSWMARRFASQSVSEPAVETPIVFPLRSARLFAGEFSRTPTPRNGKVEAVSQIAIIGAPFAIYAISVPAPSPISIAPAVSACTIFAPPVKSTILRSSPCFWKMPTL